MALRRISDGGVAKSAGAYLDRGRPTPGHLTEVFDQLIWAGLVAVADGDPLWELRQLSLTDSGHARYSVLSEQRDAEHAVPPPEFSATQTTTQTLVGRRSRPRPPAPGDRPGPTP